MLDREIVVANCHINITTDSREKRFFSRKENECLEGFLVFSMQNGKKVAFVRRLDDILLPISL